MLERIDKYPYLEAKYYYKNVLLRAPRFLIVHSGWKRSDVASYLNDPEDDRKVSAHFAWHKDRFVQCVPLNRPAMHAGGSRIILNRYISNLSGLYTSINFNSLSIELSGPYNQNPRSDLEKEKFKELFDDILFYCPTISVVAPHSEISDTRKDPGPGFDESWINHTFLYYYKRHKV